MCTRRRARALPHPGRGVRPPQRGEPRWSSSASRGCSSAARPMPLEQLERVCGDDHPFDGDREPSVIYGNVPQHGAPPRAARRTAASRCRASSTARASAPWRCSTIRPQLAALNRTFVNVVELTVRAVLEERPELVRHRGDARPEHRGDADARRDRRPLRRADPGSRRRDAGGPARRRSPTRVAAGGARVSGIRLDAVTKVYPNGVKAVDARLASTSATASSSSSSARRAAASRRCCG